MRLENDTKLDFDDVLIRPKRSTLSSRSEVILERTFKFKHSDSKFSSIPIMAANMDHTGTFEVAKELSKHNLSTCLHKFYNIDELAEYYSNNDFTYTWYSMGITENDFEKLKQFLNRINGKINANNFKICLDVANGYQETFVDAVKKLRDSYQDIILLAGNVVTAEMTEELILNGTDAVKVGIGPGSCCTTRKVTGVGYPQLSAIIECADAAHGLGGLICSDGGCVNPGDIVKAFGANADFVMLGGMLSGYDECNGEIIEKDGNKFKEFYGMSSDTAMKKYYGKISNYRSSEGRTVLVPYKGKIENRILEILGGLRSGCTYTGSKSLKELSKRTTFIKVNNQYNKIFGQ